MAFSGFLTAVPLDGCASCCPSCSIGEDNFSLTEISEDWIVVEGDWESDGVLTGTGEGMILYTPGPASDEDPIKVKVDIAITGEPAIVRLVIDAIDPTILDEDGVSILDEDGNPMYSDIPPYSYVEIRMSGDSCAELEIFVEGSSAADPVPLFGYDDDVGDTISLEVCYIPNVKIQALVQIPSVVATGEVWGTVWTEVELPDDSGVLDELGQTLLDENDEPIEEEIGHLEDRMLGLEIVEGTVEFDNWLVVYHYTEEKNCPRCTTPCGIMVDEFIREISGDSLGCHWFETEEWVALETTNCDWVAYTENGGIVLTRHATTKSENHQYIRVVPVSDVASEAPHLPACRATEEVEYSIVFGAESDLSSYYTAEFWYTEETGGAQWHCRLTNAGSSVEEVEGAVGVSRSAELHVCYKNNQVVAVAYDGAGTPMVGLRSAVYDITGRYAGIQGTEGAMFGTFYFYQDNVVPFQEPQFGRVVCFDCNPFAACGICEENQTVPEILMGTLEGVDHGIDVSPWGGTGDTSSEACGWDLTQVNKSYLTGKGYEFVDTNPTAPDQDCCRWINIDEPFLTPSVPVEGWKPFDPYVAYPGVFARWGTAEYTGPPTLGEGDLPYPPLFSQDGLILPTFCTAYNTTSPTAPSSPCAFKLGSTGELITEYFICNRVVSRLNGVSLYRGKIFAAVSIYALQWQLYITESPNGDGDPVVQYYEEYKMSLSGFGNPFVGQLLQTVFFHATLPDPLDCEDIDIILSPLTDIDIDYPDGYADAGGAANCLGYGSLSEYETTYLDFSAATLRIRGSTL